MKPNDRNARLSPEDRPFRVLIISGLIYPAKSEGDTLRA